MEARLGHKAELCQVVPRYNKDAVVRMTSRVKTDRPVHIGIRCVNNQ